QPIQGLQADAPRDAGITHTVGPNASAFGFLAPTPSQETDELTLTAHLGPDAPEETPPQDALVCDAAGVVQKTWPLAPAEEAEHAAVGQGVQVHTVGWWVNGSSFYTNLDRYHNSSLPQGYLGEYGGGEALKVYIYDEDPDELPPRYERAGYLVTIEGFNEALKGITTQGARIAYLQPEEAYTRADREGHPLYGDALIFYIEVTSIDEVPCEVPEPVCDVPRTPDPPEPPALGPVPWRG
ncbi:MAG: FKBP-type peptidyl-prolyl cis-trans isomerase, partial [Candidatus Thermoplasmatota archaeon]|nr:FKBP-type peptidyl-prolyl cis-trans isomerase [Candidatus Thermoplasmatota archaeon]